MGAKQGPCHPPTPRSKGPSTTTTTPSSATGGMCGCASRLLVAAWLEGRPWRMGDRKRVESTAQWFVFVGGLGSNKVSAG